MLMNDQERPRGRASRDFGFRRWSPEDEPWEDEQAQWQADRPSPHPRAPGGYDEYNAEFDPTGGAGEFDEPSRFDISTYREGLFGGPGADLIGDSELLFTHQEQELDLGYGGYPPDQPWGGFELDESHPSYPQQQVPEPVPQEEASTLVRPYSRTGGRTRPDYDLAIEALVSTSARGMQPSAASTAEHRSICGLCMDARSVAEVAAHLRLPLGVARVLIGDMAGLGLVMVHQSSAVVGDRPSMEFLERVLSGLRRL